MKAVGKHNWATRRKEWHASFHCAMGTQYYVMQAAGYHLVTQTKFVLLCCLPGAFHCHQRHNECCCHPASDCESPSNRSRTEHYSRSFSSSCGHSTTMSETVGIVADLLTIIAAVAQLTLLCARLYQCKRRTEGKHEASLSGP